MRLFFFLRHPVALIIAIVIGFICYSIIYFFQRTRGKSNPEAHAITMKSVDLVKWTLLVLIFVGFIGWAIYDSFR